MTMMEWKVWQPIYLDIVKRLGFSREDDYEATGRLTQLLRGVSPGPLLQSLEQTINKRVVIVFGAGPSLETHLTNVITSEQYKDAILVAVDGATSAFVNHGDRCDIIVTDLDGDLDHILQMSKRGALPIVHAHGDNMDSVEAFVPQLKRVLGSTQVEPTSRAFLWGGFTDGDRACYLVESYAPQKIILAGMDFGEIVGRWSKPHYDYDMQADERKQMKLEIGKVLLDNLISASDVDFEFMRS
jgi:uncharacterized Rossmann fold enzyme